MHGKGRWEIATYLENYIFLLYIKPEITRYPNRDGTLIFQSFSVQSFGDSTLSWKIKGKPLHLQWKRLLFGPGLLFPRQQLRFFLPSFFSHPWFFLSLGMYTFIDLPSPQKNRTELEVSLAELKIAEETFIEKNIGHESSLLPLLINHLAPSG